MYLYYSFKGKNSNVLQSPQPSKFSFSAIISSTKKLKDSVSFSENLRRKIPLFNNINYDLYKMFDLSGFFIPEGVIETYREELEAKLGYFVVSYDKNVCNLNIPLKAHLCAVVKGADLNNEQKKLLTFYEKLSKPLGVTFVVFQNPIEYIDPYQSAIYSLYKTKSKL